MMPAVKAQEYLSSEIAVLASVILHVLAVLSWEHRDLLARFPLFRPLAKALRAPATAFPRSAPALVPTLTFVEVPEPQRPKPEERRTFIETDASQVSGEQPPDSKFYSDKSTVAANPENPTGKIADTPYLDGKETRVMNTETVVPSPASAPSPAIPPTPPSPPPPKVMEKPVEPEKKVADEGIRVVEEKKLVMAEKPVEPPQPPARPPTPAQAGSSREIAARKSRSVAVGVSRMGVAAFNVESSPYGEYDKALVRAIQSRWFALIDQNQLSQDRPGTVTLHFYILNDGTIKEDQDGHPIMEQKENTAGIVLASFCEKAILDSAPFQPFPEKLWVLNGGEPREVDFTFYY